MHSHLYNGAYGHSCAESAYADACRPGNPRDTSVEEIVELYKSQL